MPNLFDFDSRSVVWSLVQNRWYALGSPKRTDRRPDLAGGRLLYYEPDRNLACGAACLSSGGFFDVNNVPPWDTWLCLTEDGVLVSWVPPDLVDRVAAGIEVNPEVCIQWPAASGSPFNELLSREGLL
jgi:hypothetical protein